MSNIKPDYFVFEKKDFSFFDLTQEILKSKQEKIKEKKLTVSLVPLQNARNTNLKKDALEKVVDNLIDNAIDYTPVGGKITIQITQKDNTQYFEIEDTGIGIPENEQTHVFEKFFRASNSMEHKIAGSGLGLYIVKKIIDGYAGKIRFESNKSGSKFIFEILLHTLH